MRMLLPAPGLQLRSADPFVVSAPGQVPGLVMRSGGAAAARLREADPDGSCCVSLDW